MTIDILHFSDLHFEDKNKPLLVLLRDKMIVSLKKYPKIDIVIFSGDIVNKPSMKEFQNAFSEFVEPILIALDLTVSDCFFTIGNHDVENSKRDVLLFPGLKEFVIEKRDKGVIASLINGERTLEEFTAYKSFIDSLNQDTLIKNHNLYSVYKKTINGITFGNLAINSSIFMEKSSVDYGNLWLITELLLDLLKELDDCNIKTLNIHHSLNWFKNHNEIKKILLDKFNVVFFGHEHEHDGNRLMDLHNRDILSLHASSIYHANNERNGYCIYSYDTGCNELSIHKSEYNNHQNIFELFKENVINEIDLMNKSPKAIRNQHICAGIYPELKKVINRYLAINLTTDTNKKDLEEIYVHPLVLKAAEEGVDENKEKETFSLEKIVKFNGNILLEGKSECGKTTLLNMFNLTYLKNYSDQIPIYISGGELHSEKSIRIFFAKVSEYFDRFYGTNKLNIESMIREKRFIFLIDDIHYLTDTLVQQIIELNNPIVATLTIKEYANIEEKFLHFSKKSDSYEIFNKLEIKPLRKQESKKLATNIVPHDSASRVSNSVYKTINRLRLPSNPFVTTLLIWMHMEKIEIRENEPQIIDLFLDYLLEKSDLSKRFKGKFDFNDKKNLLSVIAHKFFIEESLAIREDKILETIIEYSRHYYGFEIDSKDILDYFYDRRIFIRNNGLVQFSYRVFYYYFIAYFMINNKDFYVSVVQNKSSIVNMIDELRYYAAIKRDDTDIIETLQEYISQSRFNKQVNLLPELDSIIMLPRSDRVIEETSTSANIEVVLSDEEKILNCQIDTLKTENRESRTEEYNKEHDLSIYKETRYREEYLVLNMILAEFIKNLTSVKVSEKKRYLDYSVSKYAAIFRYWENVFEDKALISKFMNINHKSEYEKIDEKERRQSISLVSGHVLSLIAQIAYITLGTPKMTKVYDECLEGANNIYSYFYYLLLKSEVNNESLALDDIENFISSINNNRNLDKILFMKLLHDYTTKDITASLRGQIKKLLLRLELKINNAKIDRMGVNLKKANEAVDEKIRIATIVS